MTCLNSTKNILLTECLLKTISADWVSCSQFVQRSMFRLKKQMIFSFPLEWRSQISMYTGTNCVTMIPSGSIEINIEWILFEKRRRGSGHSNSRSIASRENFFWKLAIEEQT